MFTSKRRNTPKAVADFSRVIELDPKHVGAFVFRGNALAKMKSYANATQDFQSVIKLAPEDSEGYNSLAWLLATCPEAGFRDAKKAIELAKKACTLSSYEEPRPLDTLAAAYAENGDFHAAERWQARALRLLPIEERDRKNDYQKRLKLYEQGKPYRSQ
jgi:Flp pilus assembly protein TadD